MSEKRKEHRLRANIPVTLVWGKEKKLSGMTDNISRLGAFVEIDTLIPAGEAVTMTLELPAYTQDASAGGAVSCSGTVFRSNALRETEAGQLYGAGIFFTGFAGSRDKNKISAYIDYLIAAEAQGIKEGLKRRKAKEAVNRATKQDAGAAGRHDAFQKEALALLQQISSRLENLERLLDARKK